MKRIKNFKKYLFAVLAIVNFSCGSSENQKLELVKTNSEIKNKADNELLINCASIYPNKNYELRLLQIIDAPSQSLDDSRNNYVMELKQNGKIIAVDSIISTVGKIKFEDFNQDEIKDILIQNNSDVRSNWTYNLYLVDTTQNSLKKIKGFNQIKNPHFLGKYNLIDNEVMSGKNWTSFYQIQKDTVFDFGYVVYQGTNDGRENVDYNKEYEKTLNEVLNNKNYH